MTTEGDRAAGEMGSSAGLVAADSVFPLTASRPASTARAGRSAVVTMRRGEVADEDVGARAVVSAQKKLSDRRVGRCENCLLA
jgi:hypothetical protein